MPRGASGCTDAANARTRERTLDEANQTAGAAANLAQGVANTTGSARDGRAGSAGDLGETLLGLGGSGALVAAASSAHGRGPQHGAGERRDHLVVGWAD